jgi:hypothetical protein
MLLATKQELEDMSTQLANLADLLNDVIADEDRPPATERSTTE